MPHSTGISNSETLCNLCARSCCETFSEPHARNSVWLPPTVQKSQVTSSSRIQQLAAESLQQIKSSNHNAWSASFNMWNKSPVVPSKASFAAIPWCWQLRGSITGCAKGPDSITVQNSLKRTRPPVLKNHGSEQFSEESTQIAFIGKCWNHQSLQQHPSKYLR